MNPKHVLVIDVESVGLHGQACQVAGVVVERDMVYAGGLEELRCFKFTTDPQRCLGTGPDLQWVLAHVPQPCPEGYDPNYPEGMVERYTHDCPEAMMEAFWVEWRICRLDYPGIIMAAECAWPVEARFLAACVDRRRSMRREEGPYPLHDIASMMLAAGMDPLAEYDRRPEELPKHDPLADARQSARLMDEALRRLPLNPQPAKPIP